MPGFATAVFFTLLCGQFFLSKCVERFVSRGKSAVLHRKVRRDAPYGSGGALVKAWRIDSTRWRFTPKSERPTREAERM